MVARPSFQYTFYLQNVTSARVCHVTYDQHPRTNYTAEFPLYLLPRPITIFPGAVLVVAARPAVSWSLVLPANHYVVASPA